MKQGFDRRNNLAEGVVFWISVPEAGNCQIDECEAPAVVDVDSPVAVKGIRACYRHMSFAMEDVGQDIIQKSRRDRLRLIQVMKLRIPEEQKGGYEYD